MGSEWFYQERGEPVRPLTSDELREKAALGIVRKDSIVRRGWDGEWVQASRLKDITFGAPPAEMAPVFEPVEDYRKPLAPQVIRTKPQDTFRFGDKLRPCNTAVTQWR